MSESDSSSKLPDDPPSEPSLPAGLDLKAHPVGTPEVQEAIRNTLLGRRVSEQKLEDHVNSVSERIMIAYPDERDVETVKARAIITAKNDVVSEGRSSARRDKTKADPDAAVHTFAMPRAVEPEAAIDRERAVAAAREAVEKKVVAPHIAETFERLSTGETVVDIAKDLGVPPKKLYKDIDKGKKRLSKYIIAATAIAGACWVIYLGMVGFNRGPEANHDKTPPKPVVPDLPVVPTATPQQIQAAALMKKAQSECDDQQWEMCQTHLGTAVQFDPRLYDDATFKTLRDRAADAMNKKTNPGNAKQ